LIGGSVLYRRLHIYWSNVRLNKHPILFSVVCLYMYIYVCNVYGVLFITLTMSRLCKIEL
jgi:hypothetical protein